MLKDDFMKGMSFLLLAQILVALNIVVSKILVATIPVMILLLIRFFLAAVVLLPLHWLTAAKKTPVKTHLCRMTNKDWLFIVAQGLCAGFLFNALMLAGLNLTDANVAGIITSALPAIIAIMSWIVLKERISAQKSLCVLFATAGLVIIAVDKLKNVGISHSFLGDAIVLLSLLPEATYYVLCKLHTNKLPIFLTSSILNGINAVLLLPVLGFIQWQPAEIPLLYWFIIFVTGLSSGLFYVFWFLGSQKVDSIMGSLSTAIMPVATVLIAWGILGEKLSVVEFGGMSLVILSIFMYARR